MLTIEDKIALTVVIGRLRMANLDNTADVLDELKRRDNEATCAPAEPRKPVDSTIAPGDVIVFGADHREWKVTSVHHGNADDSICVTVERDNVKHHLYDVDIKYSGAWFASRAAHPQSAEVCDGAR